ncbi:MAG: phosphopyruvate hydratase [Patescibacteria group bacterium]
MRVDYVEARAIVDTRGRPTVETTIAAHALTATASVPAGKSTGTHEAVELRDTDGGVAAAIENVNTTIRHALVGRRFETLDELDTYLIELDGTPNKARLGANAILSVSIAAQRLAALLADEPLWRNIARRVNAAPAAPHLYMNVMNGGVHADFKLPFQEYILVIEGETSSALATGREAFAKLGEKLGADTPMGDEGGYAPSFDTLERPFEILTEIAAHFSNVSLAIDAAASEFYKDGSYMLLGTPYSADQLTTIYRSISEKYAIHSIEDPFDEEAAPDFTRLTEQLGNKLLIVGDDFTVTNPARIKKAAAEKAVNAVLIKPNQIGTVMEALQAVADTRALGWQPIASHRSGETLDTFIADFAYGTGCHGIKAGGLGQRERLEKYERLLAIEQEAKVV